MQNLTEGSEAKIIIRFTLPLLAGTLFQQLYNVIDSMIVGNYLGRNALAAVGQSFPIMFFFVSLAIGFTIAANILIARYVGAKNDVMLKRVIHTSLIIILILAITITILGLLLSPTILRLMKSPPEIYEQAVSYLRIMFVGMISLFAYNTYGAFFRGFGDSKNPLKALILAALVNIVLDFIFVLYFNWGVQGAGIATILSQVLSFFWLFYYSRKLHPAFKFNIFKLEFDRELFIKTIKLGIPSGAQNALVSLGMITLTSMVNSFGANAAAAYAATVKLDNFATLPAMSISTALSSFTGQNFGAKKYTRIKKGLRVGLLLGVSITGLIFILTLFFGKYAITAFVDDSMVVAIGTEYLRIVSISYIFTSILFILSGTVRGLGNTFFPMITTIIGIWGIRIPAATLLSRFWGLRGIWIAIVCGFFVGATLLMLYYKFGAIQKKIQETA